ncbi:hypothetical protein [Ralstonia sp. TCR112]|uniref:hypothetical protein n=1 Tax=Ralstonia sp. TCR112 TaxID=2601730 RepID=UPI0011BDC5B0|nr:hypothetical protein [Ralstonia sp. TCR112]
MSDEQNCSTCAHRRGFIYGFWHCVRTGWYCDVEVKHGGRCQTGSRLSLWEPRAPLHRRVIRIFTGMKA